MISKERYEVLKSLYNSTEEGIASINRDELAGDHALLVVNVAILAFIAEIAKAHYIEPYEAQHGVGVNPQAR